MIYDHELSELYELTNNEYEKEYYSDGNGSMLL